MDKEFKLPDPGEGIHEAEVVEILVSEGDEVEEGQSVVVMETDKAANEVPSPYTGTIKEIKVEEGQMVRVGETVMIFSVEGQAAGKEEAAEKEPVEEGAGEEEAAEEAAKEQEAGEKAEKKKEPVPASPATRRLARELDVDLAAVSGSGPHGRVTDEDVRKAAEEKPEEEKAAEDKAEAAGKGAAEEEEKAEKLPDFSKWGPVERKPLRSVRRTIAKRTALSWKTIPHVTHEDQADITDLEHFRADQKETIQEQGAALTLTPFILKAAVAALKEHPRFNASLDSESEEILYKHYYHIGVAVDTERGLLVPVIRDVDRKSLSQLALELYELAERTRNGEASLEEMSGATFTITNVGSLGGTGFTPIINHPQAAILGMARSTWRPVVQGVPPKHKVVPRLMLPLALGFDHRLADGADAARFMNNIIEYLRSIDNLMMHL